MGRWEDHVPGALGWRTAAPEGTMRPVTITITTTPVDDDGLLLHADDALAQACLTTVNLTETLNRRGIPPSAILAVRLIVARPVRPADLVEVVAEELVRLDVPVPVRVVVVGSSPEPGMFVRLSVDVRVTDIPSA